MKKIMTKCESCKHYIMEGERAFKIILGTFTNEDLIFSVGKYGYKIFYHYSCYKRDVIKGVLVV